MLAGWLASLLVAAAPVTPQEVHPGDALHTIHRLQIEAGVDVIEGAGPSAGIDWRSDFSGQLSVWVTGEGFAPIIQVRDAQGGLLETDDGAGGTRPPCALVFVEEGSELSIRIAANAPDASGPALLHLVASPETEETRAAVEWGHAGLLEVQRLRTEGQVDEARQELELLLDELVLVEGIETSATTADLLNDYGVEALVQLSIRAQATRALSLSHGVLERTLPEDHPDLLQAKNNLANLLGDLASARALREAVLEAYERTLPEDHPDLLMARGNLANSLQAMGDLAGARALREAVLEARERTMPADHPDILSARDNLAISLHVMGDLAGARALREAVLEARERTLPEDHPDILRARANLAISLHDMGDLAGARALREAVLEAYERTLPEDHPALLQVRNHLAISLSAMGDLAGARALEEGVLEAYERTLPEDHPDLLRARNHLAISLHDMGDLAGARSLCEAVLAARERTLPEDHPDLLSARSNVAVSLHEMGDFAGARALCEAVLEARERTLPADHPDILWARDNLASSLHAMGDLVGARALREAVLEAYERTLPEDHPDILSARNNLAISLKAIEDLAGARALREAVLAARERTLPEEHPDILSARDNLAGSLYAMGDLAGARALWQAVLEAYERTLLEEHPNLLSARNNLANSLHDMGDLAGARALLPALCEGMRARVLASLALSPRQSSQAVGSESNHLASVHFLSESAEPELQKTVFELTETLRLVSGEAARSLARSGDDAELAPILAAADEVRRELNDLMAGTRRDQESPATLPAELTRLSLERDRLEGQASRLLAERGVVTRPVEVEALVEALGPKEALVGYRRLAHWAADETTGAAVRGADHLVAHVLRADGALTRVDLGPAEEIEDLVAAWRVELGAPLASRGVGLRAAVAEGREVEPGERLRRRVLDPVLDAAGDPATLHVCADDVLHLIPLEALPLDAGRAGDSLRIVNEVSFARLLQADSGGPAGTEPSLVAVGDVDFSAVGDDVPALAAASAPIEAAEPVTRSGSLNRFAPLAQTRKEIETLGRLFESAFEQPGTLLAGPKASKSAFFAAAPGKRYVHLATHGWFAPESVKSTADPEPGSFARMDLAERVTGLAPMTLCGLALAGANRGRTSTGRVPGVLTAEELCSLDLSQCELAVLSACETNVGIRRAGQGIQSLQAALYAAGARTSVTSLWKVDDAATRKLMEHFYTNLWLEKMGKAEALWQAKVALREAGHPVRDWAGWVLTGDPN